MPSAWNPLASDVRIVGFGCEVLDNSPTAVFAGFRHDREVVGHFALLGRVRVVVFWARVLLASGVPAAGAERIPLCCQALVREVVRLRGGRSVESPWVRWRLGLLDSNQLLVGLLGSVGRLEL